MNEVAGCEERSGRCLGLITGSQVWTLPAMALRRTWQTWIEEMFFRDQTITAIARRSLMLCPWKSTVQAATAWMQRAPILRGPHPEG